MGLLQRIMKQTCVYWSTDSDRADKFGNPISAAPIEIPCRWEDGIDNPVYADESRILADTRVFVGQDVDVDGFLLLGTLADVQDMNDPKQNPKAFRIKKFDKTPNLRATDFVRIAYL